MAFLTVMFKRVINDLPYAIVFPWLLFLPVFGVLLARRRAVERRVMGFSSLPFWRELAGDALMGILAGFLSSLFLLYFGIPLYPDDFVYVLPIALLLMLFDLRYLCLAYAAGILCLIHLACGRPAIHPANLLALVAVLHLTESIMIAVDGHTRALPAYFRTREYGTVGGYFLQRIWPMPLLYLSVATGSLPPGGGEYLHPPSWWPLLPLGPQELEKGFFFFTLPAAVILGYGDLVLRRTPRLKTLRTAGTLALYAIVLLAMAVMAGRYPGLLWVAALLAPLGHETVLYFGRQGETRGRPFFTPGPEGVPILDVLPDSPAARAGLAPGMIITKINGRPVHRKSEAVLGLMENPFTVTITARPVHGGERDYELRYEAARVGILFAPEPEEHAHLEITPWRFFSWWGRKR